MTKEHWERKLFYLLTPALMGDTRKKRAARGHRLTIAVAAGELPLRQVVLFGDQVQRLDATVKAGAPFEARLN